MWLSNPIANPLFQPVATLCVGLLGVALLAVVVIERGRLGGSVLFRRWRVWAAIAPIYSLALLSGALTTLVLVLGLTVQGLREYCALVRLPETQTRILLGLGLLAAPVALVSVEAYHSLPVLLFLLATLQPLLLQRADGVRQLAFAALGWGYIAWFLAHAILLYRLVDGGPGILFALGLGTAMSDVGAFVVGKSLGRHKLAPRLSPNKTWEGVGGNILGAYLGVGLMSFALPAGHSGWLLAVLPVVIGLSALWGDLLESSIKREFSVKDAGDWLPGFGGLLDRIDSLIVVVPIAYYVLQVLR